MHLVGMKPVSSRYVIAKHRLWVWIYEVSDNSDPNMYYVHHDFIISANPLCTDCTLKGEEKGVLR